jgi:hypothetical protein
MYSLLLPYFIGPDLFLKEMYLLRQSHYAPRKFIIMLLVQYSIHRKIVQMLSMVLNHELFKVNTLYKLQIQQLFYKNICPPCAKFNITP